jgi:hypothetical protein
MRALLPLILLLPLLQACPPDLCQRACDARVEQCGEEEQSATACATECTNDGTWRTSYVECVEAAASCAQVGLCPR